MSKYQGRRFTRAMGDRKVTAEMAVTIEQFEFINIEVDGEPVEMRLMIDVWRDKGYGQAASYDAICTTRNSDEWVNISSAAILAEVFKEEMIELGILDKDVGTAQQI